MFVTFEGLDGCGKTTQARLLAESLEAEGVDVVSTREQGTPLGESIRDLVLHGDHVAPWAEAALYAAARAQHVEQVIRPALGQGATVVCDRYVDSSVAYQGVGRGLGLDAVLDLNLAVVGGLLPDRTFLIEIDPETALGRVGHDRRIERAGVDFWVRVTGAYTTLAARYPQRYVVVDGRRSVADVARRSVATFADVPEQPGPSASSTRRSRTGLPTRTSSTGPPASGNAPPPRRWPASCSATRAGSTPARTETCG